MYCLTFFYQLIKVVKRRGLYIWESALRRSRAGHQLGHMGLLAFQLTRERSQGPCAQLRCSPRRLIRRRRGFLGGRALRRSGAGQRLGHIGMLAFQLMRRERSKGFLPRIFTEMRESLLAKTCSCLMNAHKFQEISKTVKCTFSKI